MTSRDTTNAITTVVVVVFFFVPCVLPLCSSMSRPSCLSCLSCSCASSRCLLPYVLSSLRSLGSLVLSYLALLSYLLSGPPIFAVLVSSFYCPYHIPIPCCIELSLSSLSHTHYDIDFLPVSSLTSTPILSHPLPSSAIFCHLLPSCLYSPIFPPLPSAYF